MERTIRLVVLALALTGGCALAAPGAGSGYGGTYDCKGKDAAEGDYTAIVTLTPNRTQSAQDYGAYDFKMDVPGFGTYLGEAVAQGNVLAIHFGLDQSGSPDHGTGLATVKKNGRGKWTFRKFYYEREYKGGNHGTETCVQR